MLSRYRIFDTYWLSTYLYKVSFSDIIKISFKFPCRIGLTSKTNPRLCMRPQHIGKRRLRNNMTTLNLPSLSPILLLYSGASHNLEIVFPLLKYENAPSREPIGSPSNAIIRHREKIREKIEFEIFLNIYIFKKRCSLLFAGGKKEIIRLRSLNPFTKWFSPVCPKRFEIKSNRATATFLLTRHNGW